jgi:hypothetical protein
MHWNHESPLFLWTAPAACRGEAQRRRERSEDGAFEFLRGVNSQDVFSQSGVALRLPPHSKNDRPFGKVHWKDEFTLFNRLTPIP